MPIYEYHCETCNHQFELLRAFSEADKPGACPTCQSTAVRRQLSRCNTHGDGSSGKSHGSGCAGCSGGSCSSCH